VTRFLVVTAALCLVSAASAAQHPTKPCPADSVSGAATLLAPNVVKVADDGVIHRFFDTSPISPSGRYMALLRLRDETSSPKPGDLSDVILVDLKTGEERIVAQTRGWEVQLGAHVQWGRTDRALFFGDVDMETGTAKTIILDPRSGRRRTLDGPLFSVSPDGR